MADEEKKIFVDEDWKAEAQREKEKLAQEAEQQQQQIPEPSFVELLQIVMTQALAGLGALQGPGGEQMQPNLQIAKHYIDMLHVLDEKTKGNLDDDEKKMLDQVLYELRMLYVQVSGGGGPAGPGGPSGGMPPGGGMGPMGGAPGAGGPPPTP